MLFQTHFFPPNNNKTILLLAFLFLLYSSSFFFFFKPSAHLFEKPSQPFAMSQLTLVPLQLKRQVFIRFSKIPLFSSPSEAAAVYTETLFPQSCLQKCPPFTLGMLESTENNVVPMPANILFGQLIRTNCF